LKGKIFLFLFALPFSGVGVWMAWSIGNNLNDAWQMQEWHSVEARLTNAGYSTNSGDDSDTYEAYAQYTYVHQGQQFGGSRVAIADGADNIGSYQQNLGRELANAWRSGQVVTVFVNPANPAEAIYDRSVRWGLVGFKSVFLFVFGGVGLFILISLFRAPKSKDLDDPRFADTPWLANNKWQGDPILSNSKLAMYAIWGFAAVWSLISAPLPFVVYGEVVEKNNLPALIGLLFPVIGLGLIGWAVRQTMEWRRFGKAPLKLDPFPGSIGGHVGGTIEVNLPFDSTHRFSLTLTCLNSYISGSGKNRSRKERAEWQESQVAHVSPGASGSTVSFRFDVPEDLRSSDADRSDERYYIWRLNLNAELPGTDIDRDYEIPVYATGQASRDLSNFSINEARSEQAQVDTEEIRKFIRIDQGVGGKSLLYPMGRNLMGGTSALIFGGIFAGSGWYLMSYESEIFMGIIFGGVGALIVLTAFYLVLNSLEVVKAGNEITAIRRILGIPVQTSVMRQSEFVQFKKKTSLKSQSGKKHTIYYSLQAVDISGDKVTIGEGFKGANQARAAAELIAKEFGLVTRERSKPESAQPDMGNFLATD